MGHSPSPKRYSSRQRERDYRDLDSPRSRSPPRRYQRSSRRSPSPARRRRRDDSRSPSRRHRSRSPARRRGRRDSRSPTRRRDSREGRYNRSRSRSMSPKRGQRKEEIEEEQEPTSHGAVEINEDDDEETKMMKLMGFGGFDTTKNKKVSGADVSGAKIRKPIKYRQYMNRRGGFNRPLDN